MIENQPYLERHLLCFTEQPADGPVFPDYAVYVTDLEDGFITCYVTEFCCEKESPFFTWYFPYCREPIVTFAKLKNQLGDYVSFLALMKWLWNDSAKRPGAHWHIDPIE